MDVRVDGTIGVRVVWTVFALVVCGYGFFVASEPLYQVSTCEIINADTACTSSLFAHYGWRLGILIACSTAISALPALNPTRTAEWSAAALLTVGLISLSAILGLPVALYYAPIVVTALLLAALHVGGRFHRLRGP
ncbi:Uncharacterised protein [Nocardia otitidiscaviarum]|uniref:Uncharacterized protein n=1 Tax=Nocardia otitidiscaviarum TaxID=1823 RepID=A0A379JM79_9NOCA|nr:hypothetical protein [Nocardia otitidiscaviarum]SUD49456.1 Uncharacterised protein [Nocardia otitidiscaviarum]